MRKCLGKAWVILFIGLCLLAGCSTGSKEDQAATTSAAAEGTDSTDTSNAGSQDAFETLTLSDFEQFQAEEGTWAEEDGVIKCTGQPRGYLYSKESYGDCEIELEFRYPVAAEGMSEEDKLQLNTGVLLFVQEPHKLWPVSIEVQGKYVEAGHIKPNGGAADAVVQDDQAARESARKPVEEWNRFRIVVTGGAITSYLNGTRIAASEPGDLKEGLLGLQSERNPVEFRNIRIKTNE